MAKNHQIAYSFIAYDDIELLEKKIKFLYTREDLFIVHWNAYSSKKKLQQLQEIFKDYANVHIYSKIKVAWGMYTILLAMLENMKLALEMAPNFDHLIMLSEQCVPIKKKEYIKEHLAQYKGKSFLASDFIDASIDTSCLPYQTKADVLSGYFFGISCRHRLPFFLRWQAYLYAILDFFYYLIPIIRNAHQTCQRMKEAKSWRIVAQASGIRRFFLGFKYILLFPLRFIIFSLMNKGSLGLYGHLSQLASCCVRGVLAMTSNPGPSGCYCREDVKYLCQKENIKLAKSMRRYHSPEEYFCQTILYNSQTQRKNFFNEALCMTDYGIQNLQDVQHYANYLAFPHACFLRKVINHRIYEDLEKSLLKEI